MMRRFRGLATCSLLLLGSLPVALAAQQAVTITGHVSSAGLPVRGSSVRIESMDLGGTTDAEGRYSFIVPSTRVRGQTVGLTARYLRLRPQTVQVALVGGSLVQDFELSASDAPPAPGDRPRVTDPVREPEPAPRRTQPAAAAVKGAPSVVALDSRVGMASFAPRIDSTVLTDVPGPATLASALTGRFAGLEVLSSSAVGGTSALFVRGPHTIAGVTQPLIALNGIILDNSNITSVAQRTGGGGFDYGSAINDLNLEDIASVQLLRGPAAAMRFGGRAANGVLIVTTKTARGLHGFSVSGSQQLTSSSVLRLPSYQNSYGQGLAGQFAFFDGKGGGTNDGVDQSWGPALLGQAVTQASLTEAGRPDVRTWLAQPNNVRDYFASARTLTTNLGVQGGNDLGQIRVAVGNRSAAGVTPQSKVATRSAVFNAGLQPSPRLAINGDLQYYSDRGEDRPGSGFDESNNVSVFSHMGRQVDVLAYKTRLRDAKLAQLSWNYAGRNNPWFAVLENDNHDDRSRILGGASASYALSDWVTATARAGTDHVSDTRFFSVAGGWMGGYPYYAGRGDFSTGGFQSDDIATAQTNGDFYLRAAPKTTGSAAYAFTVGVGRRSDDLTTTVIGSDKLVDTAAALPVSFKANSATNALYGGIEATVRDYIALSASARAESATLLSGSSSTTVYPAVLGSIDLARMDSGGRRGTLETLVLRGGWSRSGNDATGGVLQRLGVTAATTAAALPLVSSPETTTGWEVGSTIRMMESRLGLDLTYYNERSENLVFASGLGFSSSGTLSNKGVEASLALTPIRDANGLEWVVGLNAGHNVNVVESMTGVASLALAPAVGVVTVVARPGSALGTLVGLGYLRDATGGLLLRNGRPVADSLGGVKVLGSGLPNWIGGLSSSLRRGGLEVSVLFDTHRGGKIFSVTNRAGAYAGTLAETVFRPDTGLLIAGTDQATGNPNTVHVSTEEYYHALGDIGERWIYDASFVKLREARISYTLPLRFISALSAQSARLSIVGRNLKLWADAPNIDPETVLSTSTFRGAEMGQLPSAKSIGFQLTLTP